jgi:ribonuclease HI
VNDRPEGRAAIIVMEDPSFSGTMLERVSAVVGAMEVLKRGRFTALLVQADTEVIVRRVEDRRRRWWRRERTEK